MCTKPDSAVAGVKNPLVAICGRTHTSWPKRPVPMTSSRTPRMARKGVYAQQHLPVLAGLHAAACSQHTLTVHVVALPWPHRHTSQERGHH